MVLLKSKEYHANHSPGPVASLALDNIRYLQIALDSVIDSVISVNDCYYYYLALVGPPLSLGPPVPLVPLDSFVG